MVKTTVQVSEFTLEVIKSLKKQLGSKSADAAILLACTRMININKESK